jgi:hypothetical protein
LQRPLAVRGQRQNVSQRTVQLDRQHPRAILLLWRQLDPVDLAADDL